jgi:MYND finger
MRGQSPFNIIRSRLLFMIGMIPIKYRYFPNDGTMTIAAAAASESIARTTCNDPSSTVCAVCLCSSQKLKRCQQCRSVYYCSVECQTIDWKQGHRSRCAPNGNKKQARTRIKRSRDSNNAHVSPPTVVHQSYQELLQLIHTKPLAELQQDYHRVSDHIRLNEETEERLEPRFSNEKLTVDSVSVSRSSSPTEIPPNDLPASTVASPSVTHTSASSTATTTDCDQWKWTIEHLANLHCLQWILQPPETSLLANGSQPVLKPEKARISSVQFPDQPHLFRVVFEYMDDGDVPFFGSNMNCSTRIAVELPVELAPVHEDETSSLSTAIQCLNQNRSICIRWSYSRPGTDECSSLECDILHGNQRKFPPHPWLACRHCHTPIAQVQPKSTLPNRPSSNAADTQPSSVLHSPMNAILSLPSGHFQELQDYLVCYNEGPTSIDFHNGDTNLLPPVGTLYENETLYIIHSENVIPNALCLLSIPMYGGSDSGGEDGFVVSSAYSQWLSNQPWLKGSPEWRCHTVPERRSLLEQGFDREGEFSFFNGENEAFKVTHCLTCSFCASAVGFATDVTLPTIFDGDGTTTSTTVAYQLLKHQLISLSTPEKNRNLYPDATDALSIDNGPSDMDRPAMLLSPFEGLFQNLVSISQFITHEMIHFAETKAIFTFAVVCVDETRSDQGSDDASSWTKPDADDSTYSMNTSVLRLRLFHWNTLVAKSEDCAFNLIPFLTSDDRMTEQLPMHDSSEGTTTVYSVPGINCFKPLWNRRVKILYEANEYTTPIGSGDATLTSTAGEGGRNDEDASAHVRMMRKRWDVCCPPPRSGMSRPSEPTSNTDETSNVVRLYLSRSEWNELCQELSDLSQHNGGMEELQARLVSTLNMPQSIGASPLINRDTVRDTAAATSRRSGISYITIS